MQMLGPDSYQPYEERMQKTIQSLRENLNAIRAGRANPHVLDRISIEYYGVKTPLTQVANIQIPESRMITITPWDPSTLKLIERAIQASELGINPNNDGKVIRLLFPALTEERRRDLVKQVAKHGEESKVAIRNIRRDGIDKYRGLLKSKELTEDSMIEFETEIQTLTDFYTAEIERIIADKDKDLMEI
jgi:ribosome recycling factor